MRIPIPPQEDWRPLRHEEVLRFRGLYVDDSVWRMLKGHWRITDDLTEDADGFVRGVKFGAQPVYLHYERKTIRQYFKDMRR